MSKFSELNAAEQAFTEQLLKDFEAIGGTSPAKSKENIDRFYGTRFLSLFSVMEIYLQKAGIPKNIRQMALEQLFMLSLQAFKAAMKMSQEEKTDG